LNIINLNHYKAGCIQEELEEDSIRDKSVNSAIYNPENGYSNNDHNRKKLFFYSNHLKLIIYDFLK